MSKTVLVLSSSPRIGGNSDTLCDQFMQGAIEAKHHVDKVVIAEKNINYCKGCYACEGNGKCVQKDDMSQILDKMIAADVIVLATPVYFYTMCAQLKTVIDRTVARYYRGCQQRVLLHCDCGGQQRGGPETNHRRISGIHFLSARGKRKGHRLWYEAHGKWATS